MIFNYNNILYMDDNYTWRKYNGLLKDLNVKIDDLEIEIEELRKLINELYLQIKNDLQYIKDQY